MKILMKIMPLGAGWPGIDAISVTRDVETTLCFMDNIAKILNGEVMWKGETWCQTSI